MEKRRRAPRRGLLALLLLAAAAVVAPTSADASCAGPQLRVGFGGEGPPTVRMDEPAEVRGSFFMSGCGDAIGVSEGGCSAHTVRETVTPMDDVSLVLRQRGRQWHLGRHDADEQGRVVWSVTIPRGPGPGPAVLVADTARLRIAVGPRLGP